MPVENIFVYKGGARILTARGELQWEGDGPEVPRDVESIIVDPSVTEIGKNAFYGCSKLTSIEIPSSVTSVGAYAFDRCQSLTNVVIPDSFTEIGHFAFYGCSKLTSIAIPSSVTSIGSCAFDRCKSLANVVIPDSVTEIGNFAFCGCSKLTSIMIPASIKSIGIYAFWKCKSLANVVIPDSITEIGGRAFSGCSKLTSIAIPASIKSIERGTFESCTSLATVDNIPDSVESINASAFLGCPLLQSVGIKDITAKRDTGKRSIDAMVKDMPFEDLKRVYHERKRLKSSIDLTTDANVDERIEPDGSGAALRNQFRQQQQYTVALVRVKKEKSAMKDALDGAKDDLEISDETLTQQYLATDILQSRCDELAELALAAGVDPQKIAEIRSRSLASGK